MAKRRVLLLIAILVISSYIVCADSDFQRGELEEGESRIFKTKEGFYIVTLIAVSDQSNSVIFRLNNEMSDRLREKESYRFSDGSEIVVRNVLSNEASEGKDFAGYYLYFSGNDPMKVKLHSINASVCDFDKKCVNETQEFCCYDCECGGGANCMNNECFDDEEECEKDSDCYNYDACITDSCVDGECKHERKDGCDLGKTCVEEGYVNNKKYCTGNEWVTQKEGDEECNNDYECVNGRCKESKCSEKSSSKGVILFALILLLLIIVAYTRKEAIIRKLKRRII